MFLWHSGQLLGAGNPLPTLIPLQFTRKEHRERGVDWGRSGVDRVWSPGPQPWLHTGVCKTYWDLGSGRIPQVFGWTDLGWAERSPGDSDIQPRLRSWRAAQFGLILPTNLTLFSRQRYRVSGKWAGFLGCVSWASRNPKSSFSTEQDDIWTSDTCSVYVCVFRFTAWIIRWFQPSACWNQHNWKHRASDWGPICFLTFWV